MDFYSGSVKLDGYHVDQQEDELLDKPVLTAVYGNHPLSTHDYPLKGGGGGGG